MSVAQVVTSPDSSNWSVYLINVVSGQVGPRVDVSGTQWDIPLNGIESLKTTIKKSSLPQLIDTSKWLAPWWGGVLLKYGDVPVFAGVITGQPQENFNDVELDCVGIRAILANRVVAQEFTDWSKLAKSQIAYYKLGLGTIAKRVVQAVQEKPGGALPISFPVPDETQDGTPALDDLDHQRVYEGYDLQNITCDAVLTKLSEVHNGPDIMFRPRMADGGTVTWDMWTGTEGDPRISQQDLHVWDTNASLGAVVDLSIVTSGAYQTNRVYSLGAGSGRGTLITMSEDLTNIKAGFPLLESVIAISQSTNKNVVQAHGDAVLHQNQKLIREITLTVRAGGYYPIGTYWPGDLVGIYTKGWVALEDGVHLCRLLHMSGDLNTASDIKLVMQPEVYIAS